MNRSNSETKGVTTLSRWMSGASFHVGMSVPDLQTALDFYVGLLGFEEAWRKTDVDMSAVSGVPDLRARTIVQLLVPGGSRIELQEFEPAGPVEDRALSGSGLNHLSIGVKDIHAEYDRLKDAGVEFIGKPTALDFGPDDNLTGWSVVYLKGPWGVMLEFFGPTPGYEGCVDDDERRPA